MTREQYLLTCLAEECAEVAQRVTKALRFTLEEVQEGQEENNSTRIEGELADLLTVFYVLSQEGCLDPQGPAFSDQRFNKKLASLQKYMGYAKSKGTVDQEAETDFTCYHVPELRGDD